MAVGGQRRGREIFFEESVSNSSCGIWNGEPKLECGPGPATPDRIRRVFLHQPESPRKRHCDCFRQAASERSAARPKPVGGRCSCEHKPTTAAVASGPPAARAGMGEEAAMPWQPARAHAHFLEVSPGNSFRESPLPLACRNQPASSGTLTFRCRHSLRVCREEQYKKRAFL